MKKLTDDDDGIATTNLKVTVSCPLGEETETNCCVFISFPSRQNADDDALQTNHLRPSPVFRRLSVLDDEREETHLDLSRL